jgi:hypothetical protein
LAAELAMLFKPYQCTNANMKKGLAGAIARSKLLSAKRRSEIARYARLVQLGKIKKSKERRILFRSKNFNFTPMAEKLLSKL